jgi:ankyrin repeat protein
MEFDIFNLFAYLKDEDYDKFEKSIDYILEKKMTMDDFDLNIKDDNNNYLLNYLIVQNKYNLISKILKIENIKIDIFDSDNKSILYIPIKYNYKKIFNSLLEYNKNNIGVSICDMRDNNNNIALHYAIKAKNQEYIELLLKNDSNCLFSDNNGNNALHMAIFTRDIKIIELILKYSEKLVIINSRTNIGESPLHYACNLQEIKIVKLLLNNGADINLQDFEHEYNILHYAINLGSVELVKLCLDNNIDINRQDIYGNTAIHYSVMENNLEIFNLLINSNKQINVNLWNIEGKLPLHMLFKNSSNIKKEIIDYLIESTNLNIQDNDYESCLHMICEYNIWENYDSILSKKKLDILIKNKNDIRPIDYILKLKQDKQDKFINIIVDSYLYNLESNKIWEADWENACKINLEELNFTNEDIKKMKDENIKINNKKNKRENCKDIIKTKIMNLIENKDKVKSCSLKTFPIKRGRICISLQDKDVDDQYKNLKFCTFTGSTLDVLLGLIYLLQKHENSCSSIPRDFRENKQLCSTYNNLGIVISNKCEFLNFEIVWVYNKIHFIDNFDTIIDRCLYNESKRFFIIPIGIELTQGSHANYLILDKEKGEIERFEPNGSGNPYNFNYNGELLDKILEKKFKELFEEKFNKKIKYFKPSDYLPKISLQMLDIVEKKKKKIGDPGGFCALWSIYYTDMRLTYKDIPREKIIKYIINTVKEQNISYKNLIRNYAFKIIEIRDNILNKANIDINDWLNDNLNNEQFDIIMKEIANILNKLN